jgi:GNAT superfamily N-acetyltransferase
VVDALADITIDCVDGGASIGFMHPLSRERAVAFWTRSLEKAARGERVVLLAVDGDDVVGTVSVVLDTPDNQPHRADLAKMQVHRRARGRGCGEALLRAAERVAREAGRTLLVLDTVTGSDASRLYTRLGWTPSGEIPNYALLPRGGLCSTTIYFRELPP